MEKKADLGDSQRIDSDSSPRGMTATMVAATPSIPGSTATSQNDVDASSPVNTSTTTRTTNLNKSTLSDESSMKTINTQASNDALRTPAPSTGNAAGCSDGATGLGMSVNPITPFVDGNLTEDVKRESLESQQAYAHSTSPSTLSVSRRGGRLVSPSQRSSVNLTSRVKTEEDTAAATPVVMSSSATVSQEISGTASELSIKDQEAEVSNNPAEVLEYKTYRSPSRKVGNQDDGDHTVDTSTTNKRVRIMSFSSSDVNNNDERSPSCTDEVSSNRGSLKAQTDSNNRIQKTDHSTAFEQATDSKDGMQEANNRTTPTFESRDNDRDLKKDESAYLGSRIKKVDEHRSEFCETESDSHQLTKPADLDNAIPCRSPTRSALFGLDDLKSPGVGMFWLSPGPPTPKSPGKKESYMATPTEFMMEGHRSSRQYNGNNHKISFSGGDKCPDTAASFDTTSNVLSWLQSPAGLFSPGGGFESSLSNTPIHKTPRTPIVSTSFFFSDAASLPKNSNGAGAGPPSMPPKVISKTYTNIDDDNKRWNNKGNNNVICVSPMLFVSSKGAESSSIRNTHGYNGAGVHRDDDPNITSNSLMNTPAAVTGSTPVMDLKNVFASPQEKSGSKAIQSLPLLMNDDDDDEDNREVPGMSQRRRRLPSQYHHHLPPRVLPQRSSSSSKLDDRDGIDAVHRHLAERDLMEDEDLSVLLQLASNNNPNTPRSSSIVFRSSPLIRQGSNSNRENHKEASASDTAGSSAVDSDIALPARLQLPMATSLSHRRLNSSSATTNSHPEKHCDFDPPPISGLKSNSSSSSKEIYVGSWQRQQSKQSQDAAEDAEVDHTSKTKSVSKEAMGSKSLTTTPSRSIGEATASATATASPTYPMHYPFSMTMGHTTSYVGPHPPLSMSGSMRVVIGGPPPPPPGSSSTKGGTSSAGGQYGEYPGMPSYPTGHYGQYPPPPSHHSYSHVVGGYPSYPQSHYPPPLQNAPSGASCTITGGHFVTPKSGKTGKAASSSNTKGSAKTREKKSKVSSGTKRESPQTNVAKPGSSDKRRKSSTMSLITPVASMTPSGDVTNSGVIPNRDTQASATKKPRQKSPGLSVAAKKAAAVAATVAAGNTPGKGGAKNGNNSDAAALAAAILRGVTMRPSGKWQAQLYFAGKSRYIGVFDNREKAALAYEIAREKLKNGEKLVGPDKASTENLVNAARKAAFDGVNGSGA